jgi:hypothetical protein
MQFHLALEEIRKNLLLKINRENFQFDLYFCKVSGYLMVRNYSGEITPYVISEFDFNYDWEVLERY